MVEVVKNRKHALAKLILGVESYGQEDIGKWKWSLRPVENVATWRHENDWSKTVYIKPVSFFAVGVYHPSGFSDSYRRKTNAIQAAKEWMGDNQ